MYKLDKLTALIGFVALLVLGAQGAFAQSDSSKFPGIGRHATMAEVAAWDIDVRPDFKGLPKGSGSASKGEIIWEAQCSSCHGSFGESNEIFTPIVGGTSKEDQKTGKVASLKDNKQPQRTTLMKVATVSTLWDYIYRAMPWNAPRSLSADDTYALVAYILSLGEIVPSDFVLSNTNIAEVQAKMPNRNGMNLQHGMWNANGKPDVNAKACMNNCTQFVQIGSTLPEYARNAHGDIALQNREYGPYRGSDSTKPPLQKLPAGSSMQPKSVAVADTGPAALFKGKNCSACHAPNAKLVGPSIEQVAAKYKNPADLAMLSTKVIKGGAGAWGAIPMPAQDVTAAESKALVEWMLSGGK
ncbi:c-type cytochrome [Polynucleobacter sp. AP-Sving-400A-A2]|uniref:c-type cytochrome n=1 Tax=Polynucleobacter sp. AP-Sving-400A-A2 TaxID=2081049 RepID=UPI001BFD511B|nr:c-type cytochrome [Polynucleobacter sp. AP-Sving-400A-A2]QWE15477.1 c-type cytochrome [Polynucleobacter sp. AP-Sving-400A-A2]